MIMRQMFTQCAVCAFFVAALPAVAQAVSYSPYASRDFPEEVYFGDTHLHTSASLDAFGDGNTTVGPDEAYRWAQGETLAGDDGMPVRISRPLDFLMVADHAEYLGLLPGLSRKNPLLMQDAEGARWARMIEEGSIASEVFSEIIQDVTSNSPRLRSPEFEEATWRSLIEAAEANNHPGRFTAFIGFEYSPSPEGNNLHRVVMFRDGKDKAGQVRPFSAFDSQNPEDLWSYLQRYEEQTGGRVLAIPHNGNLSGGRMFALTDTQGRPLTREYAERRMRWEPVYEVTQYKGDGETHPYLSPTDEFADFERWDKGNLAMPEPHSNEYFATEYARSALKLGLNQQAALGVNPFNFGMIGATDSHSGFAQTSEDNFLGQYGAASPNPANGERWRKAWSSAEGAVNTRYGWESQSGGLAAVWARENTRAAIWDAFKRREVYATTGPRMRVRLFGGYSFDVDDAYRSDMATIGYTEGVPMGGTLPLAPAGMAPRFLLAASRDPEGANLDRIQMIKGWVDDSGVLQERVYDVVASDNRLIRRGVASRAVGSSVDLASATYTNTIGAAQLLAHWIDPDFDAAQPAFYYARVLEIPTPRWTAFDRVRFGVQMPREVPQALQERAYTSPIWYTP